MTILRFEYKCIFSRCALLSRSTKVSRNQSVRVNKTSKLRINLRSGKLVSSPKRVLLPSLMEKVLSGVSLTSKSLSHFASVANL